MTAVLRNNPPDVSRPTFVRRLLEETIKQYQRDSSLQNIIMTNAEDRDRIFNHLFSRALREVQETCSERWPEIYGTAPLRRWAPTPGRTRR